MATLETNCNFISLPCYSYGDYKTGSCVDCDDFKKKSCPRLGKRDCYNYYNSLRKTNDIIILVFSAGSFCIYLWICQHFIEKKISVGQLENIIHFLLNIWNIFSEGNFINSFSMLNAVGKFFGFVMIILDIQKDLTIYLSSIHASTKERDLYILSSTEGCCCCF